MSPIPSVADILSGTTPEYSPLSKGHIFIAPFLGSGETESGILIQHPEGVYEMFAHVVKVHPSNQEVKEGDVVVIVPRAYQNVTLTTGEKYAVIHMKNVLAVMEGF